MTIEPSPDFKLLKFPEADGKPVSDSAERDVWLTGQRKAFASALNEASLADTLAILVETSTTALAEGTRAAFYLIGPKGDTLHHIVGMSEEYALVTDGLKIASDSVACGLATHLGEPVLTADVRTDPTWMPWLPVAEKFGYRGCWSFPIHTVAGSFVGTFTLYWPNPREATQHDVERASLITQAAAVIISRYNEAEERRKAERALQAAQKDLERELHNSELLRQLSTELADETGDESLYQKLVQAAAKVMHSEVCTVQFFHPDRGEAGELEMLASIGLNDEGVKYWKWVRGNSGCTCGQVLRTGARAIAEDVETCSFMAGTPDRDVLLAGGIKAGQSTPLVVRDGKFVGMISTHWAKPHRPSDGDLRMLDIIARAAADLIERRRAAETQKLLLNELNHRVKNTLAVVQAMATQTLTRTKDPKDFSRSFGGRVQSLARTHDLLTAKSWQGADLGELIRDQVSSRSAEGSQLTAYGPPVQLNPQMALHLALIFHELATNATKYGALSTRTGTVTVEWSLKDMLRIKWKERGGPEVANSQVKGFGTTLITQSSRAQGGEAVLTPKAEGVEWEIAVPYDAKSLVNKLPSSVNREKPGIKLDIGKLLGTRILVVEDEPLIAMDLIAILEDAGAEVEGPIASIEKACELISVGNFDAAFVDANLHGKSVGPVAEALTKRKVPFAFATGYNKDGLPEGFQDVPILSKPWADNQVLQAAVLLVGTANT